MPGQDEAIAQLFLAGVPGPELTAEWRESLDRAPFGGVYLNPWNLTGPEQAAALLGEICAAIRERGVTGTPILAIDHDGGSLSPLRGGEATNLPGPLALAATGDPRRVREAGRIIGRELASLGFNLNLAPVLDIGLTPRGPVARVRTFGDQPRRVVELAVAYVRGMQEGGVAAGVRHFPGCGGIVREHGRPPVSEDDLTRLEGLHLLPFGAAAAADVDVVCASHIRVPRLAGSPLDPGGQHADLPASLNPALLERLLRRHLGFSGVIVTDPLEAPEIGARWDVGEAAVMALEAGADIPLVAWDPAARERAFRAVREAVLRGRISAERLAQSLARIGALRERIARLRMEALADVPFDPAAHRALLVEHQARAAAIALRAVCAVEPAPPLAPRSRVLVVAPLQPGLTPADPARGRPVALPAHLARLGCRVKAVQFSPQVAEEERRAVLAAARGRCDRVIFCSLDAWRFPGQAALFREVLRLGRPVTAVALGDPCDLPLLSGAGGRLATCSAEPVMMVALAAVLTGRAEPGGRLPLATP